MTTDQEQSNAWIRLSRVSLRVTTQQIPNVCNNFVTCEDPWTFVDTYLDTRYKTAVRRDYESYEL